MTVLPPPLSDRSDRSDRSTTGVKIAIESAVEPTIAIAAPRSP